jgi:hypothetical protein
MRERMEKVRQAKQEKNNTIKEQEKDAECKEG